MRALKVLVALLAVYVGIVVAFETLVVVMGKRQAEHGIGPEEKYLVITTTDASGPRDTVIGAVDIGGATYVAANHWPRGWYDRALAHPDVEVTRSGQRAPYRVTEVNDDERERVAQAYRLPFVIRALTGFPPRAFLRLDPR
jgi:F420H(2)-dependent quinone reductase